MNAQFIQILESIEHEPAATDYVHIKQAASIVQVTPKTLRSWEERGFIAPERDSLGWRIYRVADLEGLKEKYLNKHGPK